VLIAIRSASVTFVHLVIYRPGTKPATDGFSDELIALLEIVGTFRNELVITGDFNIHDNDNELVITAFTGDCNIHDNDVTDWRCRRSTEFDSLKFWSLST